MKGVKRPLLTTEGHSAQTFSLSPDWILRIKKNTHLLFDLSSDPAELKNLVVDDGPATDPLLECLGTISEGLGALDRLSSKKLDEETIEQLRALGYIE